MGKCQTVINSKTCRLGSMLALTFAFFLVELVVGHVTNSLALVGDSYHMLSDVVALIIGIASVRISKLDSRKNTYGWARAEVVGALINSVFLIALCFTIFFEAIERLTHPESIDRPLMMLIVGIVGLVINVIGLILLHGHAHGHSHHGHSHSQNSTQRLTSGDNENSTLACMKEKSLLEGCSKSAGGEKVVSEQKISDVVMAHLDESMDSETEDIDIDVIRGKPKIKSSQQLNMRGVFLHVLGDALGSVIVIISAILFIFVQEKWVERVDPGLSLILVIIILSTTAPLLKESALILLQTVPTHIQVASLKDKLIMKVEGVLAVHEFHVWQLAGNRIIASAHIRCRSLRDYMQIAEQVKSFFHNEGIHSTTIQPEFVEFEELVTERDCILECGPDKLCHVDTCCARPTLNKLAGTDGEHADIGTSLRQRSNCVDTAATSINQTNPNVVLQADEK